MPASADSSTKQLQNLERHHTSAELKVHKIFKHWIQPPAKIQLSLSESCAVLLTQYKTKLLHCWETAFLVQVPENNLLFKAFSIKQLQGRKINILSVDVTL